MKIGCNVKEYRLKAGLSQAKLADMAGIHYRTIQAWELGSNPPTDYLILIKVADALNATVDELFPIIHSK